MKFMAARRKPTGFETDFSQEFSEDTEHVVEHEEETEETPELPAPPQLEIKEVKLEEEIHHFIQRQRNIPKFSKVRNKDQ